MHGKKGQELIQQELNILELTKMHVERFKRQGVSHIVVGMDEMLWDTHALTERLLRWLPSFQSLDPFYIAPKNGTKVKESLVKFGQEHNPYQFCGYNFTNRTCDFEWLNARLQQVHLPQDIIERFKAVSNFFVTARDPESSVFVIE